MTNPQKRKLMVTGISNHWRSEYRRFRRAGFTPNDASLVIYGGIHHARQMKLTLDLMLKAEHRTDGGSMTTISFQQPCERLSLNDRHHWATKAKLTRTWRTAAKLGAKASIGPIDRPHPPCFVRVIFPVTQNRRRDPHNAIATVKPIIDGLVDAWVWPDDTDEYVIVLDPKFDTRDDGVVVVHLSERAA